MASRRLDQSWLGTAHGISLCGWGRTVPLEGSTIAVVDVIPLRATVEVRSHLVEWGFFLSHTGHDVKYIVVGLDVAWLWFSYASCCFMLYGGAQY